MTLAVLVHLQLQHFLFADIVGHHALGSTLRCQLGQIPVRRALPDVLLLQHINQLGEGRGNPHPLFVLHALVALAQRLLDNHCQILFLLLVSGFVQVHKDGDKGSLTVGGHQGNHLILDGLHASAHFIPQPILHHLGNRLLGGLHAKFFQLLEHISANLLPADLDKGSQVGQRNGLSAVLVGCHLGDNLSGNVAGGGERMGLLNQRTGNHGAVLQHILQVHQITVVHMLGIIVGVMEMNDATLMGCHNLSRQQNAVGDILRDFARHIVTLHRIDGGVFVGVLLLDLLVVALNQAEDAVIGGVGLAQQAAGIAIGDIFLGHLESAMGHDGLFHQILNLLHRGAAAHFLAGNLYPLGNAANLQRSQTHLFFHGVVGLCNGSVNFFNVKVGFSTVSLNNLHAEFLLFCLGARLACRSHYILYLVSLSSK